ncbi:MAG TPA: glycosyltransferase family 1 protein [Stellaceae bacterium]|nr:glycosyltransferase family 1 protein [Stellaceae bacterium]
MARRWLRDATDVLSRLSLDAWRFLGGHVRYPECSMEIRSGDVVVCTGMSWKGERYVQLISAAKRQYGIAFVMLFHDIIPISHPRFSLISASYRRWTDAMLRSADALMTQSRYTRDMLIAHAKEIGLNPRPVAVLRFGPSFNGATSAPTGPRPLLALPRPFVLFVSTIEARKNHLLLVRVWKRLIERHGDAAVPGLIFVGARGWLIDRLLAELAATRNLGGKIRIFSDLSDTELRVCYRHCLLTVYPSFVEGWGSPVAESLQQGKLCIVSNGGALPEVGGELLDYFDPNDEEEALAAIERAIFDDEHRARREARIRAEYRAPKWEDCCQLLLRTAMEASRERTEAAAASGDMQRVQD